ncbi:hypothetical protein Aca07nite_78610 [Actinoplanes capillaceus]|uniref:Excreted virulence factor EspC, type VII ESX diderm n=1 Tax=Actinoplanes campanulatus TaxID=113559 RepID=A0ABQ3WWA1_9ACTN|nr:hypothetical protein [Actinoplanes capillaceus]GID50586.1 hypothetical protein Aca07nite_78610 [Actinoplanes capillaceus]
MAGELFIDVAGMNSVYNQLQRGVDAADEAVAHIERHCSLSRVQQGLIVQMLTPHEVAYAEMTGALTRLRSLTQGTATQVNGAQVGYSQEDLRTAATLDSRYEGAASPDVLASELAQERLRLPTVHSGFADVQEPGAHLVAPRNPQAEFWAFNPAVDLLSPFAYLRQAAIWVFSHDPFELWTEWFAGDWDSYIKAGMAMEHAGSAAGAIADNLAAGAVALPAVWRGNAAEHFQEYELELAKAARSLRELGANFNTLYQQSAECVKNFYEVFSGFIVKMFDALLMVSIGLAGGSAMIATFAGAVVGFSVALTYAIYAAELYKKISDAYTHSENALKAIAGTAAAQRASADLTDLPAIQPYQHPGN